MEEAKRRLLWHGMLLFLLGLLTGFVEQKFNNPRMGLAAHLEGVMNGIFQSSVQRPYLRLQQWVIVLNRGKTAL
jgi:hydroxylaminobenzene mutase